MNVEVRSLPTQDAPAASRIAVGDGDIHPARSGAKDFHPWLAKRWQDHIEQYGSPARQGWQVGPAYPKSQPNASRRDAYPPEGGRPGSSLAFMQQQHLDPNNVQLGILNPLGSGQGVQNPDLSAALCHATNEWQLAEWTGKDSRLKASVVVPYEDAIASAAEIRRYADNPSFVQVLMLSRTAEPLGSRNYWPIYEAAAEAGMPVGVHAFGYGGNPVTPGRLAELLHRGDDRAQPVPAGRADQPDRRGRVRALPRAENGDDRGRLRLGAVAGLAAGQALAHACAAKRRT